MKVYVGCPIDQAKEGCSPVDALEALIDRVVRASTQPVIIYNPLRAWAGAGTITDPTDVHFVFAVNQAALMMADMGVFVWNGSPSFGVPLEIHHCTHRVLVVNTSGRTPGLYLRHAVQSKTHGAIIDGFYTFDTAFREVAFG